MNRSRGKPVHWNPFGPRQTTRIFSVAPPARVTAVLLNDLLAIYEELGTREIRDPRGHKVSFSSAERFPHMIELKEQNGKDIRKPQKEVEKIKSGEKSNENYGGYHAERAATLSWIPMTVQFPTMIVVRSVLPNLYPGNELYYKNFEKFGGKMAVLVCRRVGPTLLVPLTWYPIDRGPKESEIVYHSLPTRQL